MSGIKTKNILEQSIYMLTKAAPCPYIEGRVEKRIATDISFNNSIFDELSLNGFRRVENWMYRPVCDHCNACVSYRVIIDQFSLTKSLRRIKNKFKDLTLTIANNIVTEEHYKLFKKYQNIRHKNGSMSKMSEDEFISMVEISSVDTYLMEFHDIDKKLVGVMLIDVQKNAISAVYSFFEPEYIKHGLGNFMIIKSLLYGKEKSFKYLYLGYYIREVSSMAYKIRFKPGQILKNSKWESI